MKTVGERIRQIRGDMGWTQERLAREAGLSKSFLSDIENNKTRVSGDNLLKIAEVLGASLDYLMKGDTRQERDEPKSIEIPVELSNAAEELSISFREAIMLLNIQRSIVAKRSSTQRRQMGKEDWIRLYEKIKTFM